MPSGGGSGTVLGYEDTAVSEFSVTLRQGLPHIYGKCPSPTLTVHPHHVVSIPKHLNFISKESDWPGVGPGPHFQKLPSLRSNVFTPSHGLFSSQDLKHSNIGHSRHGYQPPIVRLGPLWGRNVCLFGSLLNPQCLENSRCSVSISWVGSVTNQPESSPQGPYNYWGERKTDG